MTNTHDPFAHHATDTLPMPTNGPYNKGPAVGEKRGYVSNSGGSDRGSAMQTDMV